jgi:predicted RND superfamily exporter protein
VCIAAGTARLHVDNSIKQYSSADNPVRKDSVVLNDKFGGTDSISFLVEGAGRDVIKDPKVLSGMAKLQAFLEQQPDVGKTQSVADLIRRMNQAMHGDDKAYNVVPTDANLVSQYLLLYSMSGQPDDFDNLVDNDYQNAVVWAYLKSDSTAYAATLWEKCEELIKREFPSNVHVRIGGGLPQRVAINASLIDTKVKGIFQMAFVVLLLAGLVFGSVVGGILVVAPLLAIVFVNFGMMGWLGMSLDMGSATIAAMVVGIGADYEIYMLSRLREEYRRCGNLDKALRTSLMTSGKAVLFVALSIAGGYAALLISDFKFYPRLATTMIGTMATSAVLSLILLRAVIAIIKPKFIVGTQASDMPVLTEPAEGV